MIQIWMTIGLAQYPARKGKGIEDNWQRPSSDRKHHCLIQNPSSASTSFTTPKPFSNVVINRSIRQICLSLLRPRGTTFLCMSDRRSRKHLGHSHQLCLCERGCLTARRCELIDHPSPSTGRLIDVLYPPACSTLLSA
ncbi:hypothetical protein M413DRAFT_237307 [Hebeloma cylindrosporum]|uniref:Uncharacterized protein n=1 Tax=Hebeloma cylindrosporum TaxID=76867 RepID=A0A0C3C5C6_HEBCY|nr:hypothetical protein M413DRAFT_237307 [Hebeloma cylindrosporum h7]